MNSVLDTFGVNGKLFLAQLLNFSIVLVVMWRWVYIPLLAAMDKRSKEISDGLAFAKSARQDMESASKDREKMIRDVRVETASLLAEARAKADLMKDEKIVEAKVEIERMTSVAKKQIDVQREAAFVDVRLRIIDLVTDVVGKAVSGISTETKHDIAAQAVKEIEKAK